MLQIKRIYFQESFLKNFKNFQILLKNNFIHSYVKIVYQFCFLKR